MMIHQRFILLILIVALANGNEDEHEEAEIRARLAKAKTVQDALIILKTSKRGNGPETLLTRDGLKKEEQAILERAKQMSQGVPSITEPRKGGCEPRVVCIPVPVSRQASGNLVAFPECIEVHQCGGCCQKGPFSCEPIEEKPVALSPLYFVNFDKGRELEPRDPWNVMNHTRCECKCSKTEDDCRREGKIFVAKSCECYEPSCSPACLSSATCSMVSGRNTPRCTCRRRIPFQGSNYCWQDNQRPDRWCSRCEDAED